MVVFNPYDRIASEYYLESHQTSRNFDSASVDAIEALNWRAPRGLLLEPGCGRGRSQEFLDVDPGSVVQLDSSEPMLIMEPREDALLRVLHAAEALPFSSKGFACVAAFLCDAFLGLNFLVEARRVLTTDGILFGTTPSYEWGTALRDAIGLDHLSTRFILQTGEEVVTPSSLFPVDELRDMLIVAGFDEASIQLQSHILSDEIAPSSDIEIAATALACPVGELPILYSFSARPKPGA